MRSGILNIITYTLKSMEVWKNGGMEVELSVCKSLLIQADKKFGNIKGKYGRLEV